MNNNVENEVESFLSCYTEEEIACTSIRDWSIFADDTGNTTAEKIQIIERLKAIANNYADKYSMNDSKLDIKSKEKLLLSSIDSVIKTVESSIREDDIREEILYKVEMFRANIKNNHKLRDSILSIIKETKYNLHCRFNEYPYFVFFLVDVCHIDFLYLNRIDKKENGLKSLLDGLLSLDKNIDNCISDIELIKSLELYREIKEEGGKDKYINTSIADKWYIDVDTFAKLLRKFFSLSKQAIKY